jgi:hypothetical protein
MFDDWYVSIGWICVSGERANEEKD